MATAATHESWNEHALAEMERLARRLEVRLARDEPLARHTSMGVGGPAAVMLWPSQPAQLRQVAAWMGVRALPWRLLGGGTNLLIGDAPIPSPVINMSLLVDGFELAPDLMRVPAGMPTPQALRRSVGAGRDGLVWASGLPGTVGGAAAGNAGCWGGDMAGCVSRLQVVDGAGEPHALGGEELRWRYRGLEMLEGLPKPIAIIAVEIATTPADPRLLERRYLDLQERKRARQPVGARNSGCVFRNPDGPLTAGQLLDAAGCKQHRVGGARVSEVHANFIVNDGTATADDVLALIDSMERRVIEHAGVRLLREIRQW